MEVWKEIKGYEGIYEVSNHGRVRTHKDKITHSTYHGARKWKQRLLKQMNVTSRGNTKKRSYVELYKNKKRKRANVARLVAEAFIPNPEKKAGS